MLVIGVTGNSGAGKSTVSTIIKDELNALIIDADVLIRNGQKNHDEYYLELLKLFGNRILNNDGEINKPLLATEIFSNENIRIKVNKITFDYIKKQTERILNENKEEAFAILNFPLLYEGKFDKLCNYVISIIVDEATKVERIIERDGITKVQALKRLATQKSEDFFIANSDFVIDNSRKTTYIELINRTKYVLNEIKLREDMK